MNIAFDLGGTFLRCGVDAGTGALQDVERVHTGSWKEILSRMDEYAIHARRRFGDPACIAVAFPGPIKDGSVAMYAPTVTGQDTRVPDLTAAFRGMPTAPVHLLNDVSAAAWFLGESTHFERFIVVTVSSGIGSKVYDRSRTRPVCDDAPFAGELGHVKFDFSENAPICDCGERGHVAAFASGRGIERCVRNAAALDMTAFRRSLCAAHGCMPHELSNERHIVPAARAGDVWTLSCIDEATLPLATVLAAAVQAYGLQKVMVIGGFACALGDVYAALLERAIRLRLSPAVFGVPQDALVRVLASDDEACLYGAAIFARMQTPHLACASSS